MASELIRHIRRAVLLKEVAGLSDGDLLESFVADRNPAAVEALVLRHGPMVWGVCRRVLGNEHDAEDAFQATFLVLARKADSIRPTGRVAGWLHGVARQTSLKARATNRKRAARERPGAPIPEPVAAPRESQDDLRLLLDEQFGRLPAKYRAVIVLCDLEGRTRREAAMQLGCPEGTVAGRLARARTMLARLLARRGLAGVVVPLAGLPSPATSPVCLPVALVSHTLKAVTAVGLVSSRVAALTEGVIGAMLLTRVRIVGTVLLMASMLAFATGTLLIPATAATAGSGKDDASPRAGPPDADPPVSVQLRIASPKGMKVRVLSPPGRFGKRATVDVPGRLDLRAGMRHRLKLTDIPNRPGVSRFPTVEIPRLDAATEAFASSSAFPLPFTEADFERVDEGKAITKVVYLAKGRGKAITLASNDHPDRDVIEEAKQRGTVLAVVRMGNIDLEATGRGTDRGSGVGPQRSGKPVEVTIGNDGIRGRVVRTDKKQATAKDRVDLEKQLAEARLHLRETMAALASEQVRNKLLEQQRKAAEAEARSLRDEVARLRQKLEKAKEALGK